MIKHNHAPRTGCSKTYTAWGQMLQRCSNPKVKEFKFYGERGITVCERWLKFENFLADMGECPKELTLERMNNNEGYCKDNCCWATRHDQFRNRRSNVNITIDGETKCFFDWVNHFGVTTQTCARVRYCRGWDALDAVSTPTR